LIFCEVQVNAQDTVLVKKQVIGSGGGFSSNSEFGFRSTIGQSSVGKSTASEIRFYPGFWSGYIPSCCLGVTGDVNLDGKDCGIIDLTLIVDRIFRGGPPPLCPGEGDLNGDGTPMELLDLTFMVDRIFRSGVAPGPCSSSLISFKK